MKSKKAEVKKIKYQKPEMKAEKLDKAFFLAS